MSPHVTRRAETGRALDHSRGAGAGSERQGRRQSARRERGRVWFGAQAGLAGRSLSAVPAMPGCGLGNDGELEESELSTQGLTMRTPQNSNALSLTLKYLRDESGSIAEHIIRSSGIAALSGALISLIIKLKPAFSNPNMDEIAYFFLGISWLSMWVAVPLLAILSISMLLLLWIDLENRINPQGSWWTLAFFGIICLLSVFALIGAGYSLITSLLSGT